MNPTFETRGDAAAEAGKAPPSRQHRAVLGARVTTCCACAVAAARPDPFRRARARRGLWEMWPREEKGIRPTAIFAVGFTEVERLYYCPFLKREFPCFVTPRRAFESVIPPRSCILFWNSHYGSFPLLFFQLPQPLSPGGFIFCFPFLFLPCSPPDGKFGCPASRSFK